MPKIKDLGINVVPRGMRPPEVGEGGGGKYEECDSADNCSCHTEHRSDPPCDGDVDCGEHTIKCDSADNCSCVTGYWDCAAHSHTTTVTPHTPKLLPGVLSRDDISALRKQLRTALHNLDVAERKLLPKTLEAIEAREKELDRERELLKARRDELKKKK